MAARTSDVRLWIGTAPVSFTVADNSARRPLLRTVERDFYNPRSQTTWPNGSTLRSVGSDAARGGADEIWSLLWHELHDLPVLSTIRRPNPGNQGHIDAMIGEIERWVNARDDNRFLLLLDEADGFLAADALTDFRESTRLKGLMDRTERRFKGLS